MYFESSITWRGDHVDERPLWLEYELEFRDGELTGVEPIDVTTREDLAKKLLKEGVAVLPDDDRVVRRHRELRSGGRRSTRARRRP